MKIVSFAGSLRKESLNKQLAQAATRMLEQHSIDVEYIDIKEYDMPVYDGDLEEKSGMPEGARQLNQKIATADALVISTPEYNGSIPGMLKNVLDWISRTQPMPISGKHLLLLSVTPSGMGGVRGLWHSRVPFEAVGVHVYPDMVGLAKADQSLFDEQGNITRQNDRERLEKTLQDFTNFVKKSVE